MIKRVGDGVIQLSVEAEEVAKEHEEAADEALAAAEKAEALAMTDEEWDRKKILDPMQGPNISSIRTIDDVIKTLQGSLQATEMWIEVMKNVDPAIRMNEDRLRGSRLALEIALDDIRLGRIKAQMEDTGEYVAPVPPKDEPSKD